VRNGSARLLRRTRTSVALSVSAHLSATAPLR
jgi:hypothetical protein